MKKSHFLVLSHQILSPMISNKDIAKKTAKQLLKVKAVSIRPENPFIWASGWQSPIYCDNRVLLSYPEIRTNIKDFFCTIIKEKFPDAELIAGVATGAIAMGVLVAEALDLPFVYVRPQPKGHGRNNQVEGHLQKGQKTVVIEDLISTGKSSMNAVEALKNEQANILGMVAIFTYDFTQSKTLFKDKNIELFTLSDYNLLLEQAKTERYITNQHIDNLKQWRINPEDWQPISIT